MSVLRKKVEEFKKLPSLSKAAHIDGLLDCIVDSIERLEHSADELGDDVELEE